jgi:hypothetical protein
MPLDDGGHTERPFSLRRAGIAARCARRRASRCAHTGAQRNGIARGIRPGTVVRRPSYCDLGGEPTTNPEDGAVALASPRPQRAAPLRRRQADIEVPPVRRCVHKMLGPLDPDSRTLQDKGQEGPPVPVGLDRLRRRCRVEPTTSLSDLDHLLDSAGRTDRGDRTPARWASRWPAQERLCGPRPAPSCRPDRTDRRGRAWCMSVARVPVSRVRRRPRPDWRCGGGRLGVS